MKEIINTSMYLLTAAALLAGLVRFTGRRKTLQTWLYPSITLASIFLNGALHGKEGIISSSIGALMALVITGTIVILSEEKEENIFIAVPIAALIGPVPAIALFSLSIFFWLVQKWTESERELVPQYFFSIDENAATAIELDERSALAEIEARKLLRTDGYSANRLGGPVVEESITNAGMLMPWSLKVVIAAMIVILYCSEN